MIFAAPFLIAKHGRLGVSLLLSLFFMSMPSNGWNTAFLPPIFGRRICLLEKRNTNNCNGPKKNPRCPPLVHSGSNNDNLQSSSWKSSTALRSVPKVNEDASPKKMRQSKRKQKKNAKYSVKRKGGDSNNKDETQTWRIFGVEVHPDQYDYDTTSAARQRRNSAVPVHQRFLTKAVVDSLLSRLRLTNDDNSAWSQEPPSLLPPQLAHVRVVRRSLDARKKNRRRPAEDEQSGPRYVFVLDVDINVNYIHELKLKHQPGRMERLKATKRKIPRTNNEHNDRVDVSLSSASEATTPKKRRVVIVGAGPAGLFCALVLARSGIATPIVLERGQPVESRGKHIGALMNRRSLDSDSNFAFGEGGAGTWSDGKLTTRIGRNSNAVRYVLETLVAFGAPETIPVDGAPHLGTDNLVKLLRNMRLNIRELGGNILFGTKVTGFQVEDGTVTGVHVVRTMAKERYTKQDPVLPPLPSDLLEPDTIQGDAFVLATGHSARDVYEKLHEEGIQLEAKGFAVGFRVEHPQKLINKIQYGNEWGPSVVTGKGSTDSVNRAYFSNSQEEGETTTSKNADPNIHNGLLPVPSYRLATDQASDGDGRLRGVYSFCMCPGGQIVPASTNPNEVCVNGMSFSRRDSLWANSALVVTVSPDDEILEEYRTKHGVLAGVAFQRDMEQRAAVMGGGNLTVPVQRLTDFIAGRTPTTPLPSSSYRLGIHPAPCHEIYPPPLVSSLRDALTNHFETKMPGFVCDDALLHGVETRTSSPVRVSRDPESLEAIGVQRLFPTGEGAGFAGGIVSAAVDGIAVAEAILLEEESPYEPLTRERGTRNIGFSY